MSDLYPLAVIGCGAISEMTYLPALAENAAWKQCTWLVEPNVTRGWEMANRFGFARSRVLPHHDALPSEVRLAINATPSHLHVPVTLALLHRGINVIVEKPLAEDTAGARALAEAAAERRRILSVNQSRRNGPSNRLVRDLLKRNTIGRVQKISWREGRPFDWPSQSGFNFRRPWTGKPRGVLLDIGVHVADLLCWWLDTTPSVLSAAIDGQGGPEANASVQLIADGSLIDLRLSYLAKLDNEIVIEGSAGAIRASTADYDVLKVREVRSPWRSVRARGPTDPVQITTALIRNMLEAIEGREPVWVDAADTIPALAVIDEAYARSCDILSECYAEHLRQPSGPILAPNSSRIA